MSEPDRKKKRGKQYYTGAKKNKAGDLVPGVRGVLLSCADGSREAKCTIESYNLFREVIEEDVQFSDPEDEDEEPSNLSVEEELAKELAEIRQASKEKGKGTRFSSLRTGCRGIVFVSTNEYDPVSLVTKIMQRAEETKETRSRYILRLVPVTHSCQANITSIKETAAAMLDPIMQAADLAPTTFAVALKVRLNDMLKKDAIISAVAAIAAGDKKHTVDLSNPDFTVIVEIMKNTCCMSCVQNYNRFKRFNLPNVAGIPLCVKKNKGEDAKEEQTGEVVDEEKKNDKEEGEEGGKDEAGEAQEE